jgi:hypothetical protein
MLAPAQDLGAGREPIDLILMAVEQAIGGAEP